MKKNHVVLIGMILLLGLVMSACGAEATPEPVAEPVVEAPVVVADTTPPQVVMTELPFVAFYNLGACTPAPLTWKAEITDGESAIAKADVLVRFSTEDGTTLSQDYAHTLVAEAGNVYALAIENSALDQVAAANMLGTQKGLFEYRLTATDASGNSQYYPSESGWAQLSFLPCYENADIEAANGEVAAATDADNNAGTGTTTTATATPTASGSASSGSVDATCLLNPSDPSCTATFANPCDVNPSDPSCTTLTFGGGDDNNGGATLDPCLVNPSSCAPTAVPVDPCVMNPSDPSCNPTPVDPCDANPSADGCTVIVVDPPTVDPPVVVDPPVIDPPVVEDPIIITFP